MALDKSQTWDWSGLRLQCKELVVNGVDAAAGIDGSAAAQATADSAVAALNAVNALTVLTNSTGVAGDNTIENVPAAVAADVDTTAASLASVNTSLTAIENSIADLAVKVNAILAAANP